MGQPGRDGSASLGKQMEDKGGITDGLYISNPRVGSLVRGVHICIINLVIFDLFQHLHPLRTWPLETQWG